MRLGELGRQLGAQVPEDLRRAKGWVGALVERALGAAAGSHPGPDFPDLGIELKTIPIDRAGKPLESTFVCTIELREIHAAEFLTSRLWGKLAQVLFVPVEGTRVVPVAERCLGAAFLWTPSVEERTVLEADWYALCLLIAQGRTGEITGHLGQALQVRPKAAKGSSRRRAFDEDGALYDEQPKGFYLRPSFTGEILRGRFGL